MNTNHEESKQGPQEGQEPIMTGASLDLESQQVVTAAPMNTIKKTQSMSDHKNKFGAERAKSAGDKSNGSGIQ